MIFFQESWLVDGFCWGPNAVLIDLLGNDDEWDVHLQWLIGRHQVLSLGFEKDNRVHTNAQVDPKWRLRWIAFSCLTSGLKPIWFMVDITQNHIQ